MGYLLSIFLFFLVAGRLSLVVDIFTEVDIPSRILTKVVWVVIYAVGLAVVLVVCKFDAKYLFNTFRAWVFQYKWIALSMLLFILISLIGLLSSFNVRESIMGLVYYIILFSLFIFGSMLGKKEYGRNFVTGWFYGALALVLVGGLQYVDYRVNQNVGSFISLFDSGGFVPASAFNFRTADNGLFLRPSSLMVDANVFAVYLSMVIIFVLDMIVRKRFTLLSLFTATVSITMLVLTASRTGVIALVVGILSYFIYRWVVSGGLRRMVKGGGYAFIPLFLERFSLNDLSTMEHIKYWIQSVKIFLKHPFFGIGHGNFPAYYREKIDITVAFATPHSVYAKFLAEGGGFGIISFGLVMVSLFVQFLKRRSALLVSIFIMVAVGNVTYDFFMTPWVWFLFGVFLSEIEW